MAAETIFDSLADFMSHCPAMLFTAAPSGALLRLSEPLKLLLGAAGKMGDPLAELIHPDDRGAFDAAWAAIVESREPVMLDLRVRDSDGGYRSLSMHARRSPARGEIHGELHERTAAMERDAKILRILLEAIPITVWIIDSRGIFTLTDGKGMGMAGRKPGDNVGVSIFDILGPGPNRDSVQGALAGKFGHMVDDVMGVPWESWRIPLRDEQGEVTGVLGVALSLTEARRAEKELVEKTSLLERQQQVIRETATPIIEVWDKVLTVPMLGVVDSTRAAALMENLLGQVNRKGSRFAILDLTGVDAVDTSTASHLLKLIEALKLLGAEGIITGLQPTVAQTMVALGVDMEHITTMAKLRDGLRLCMKRLREDKG